VLPSKEIRRDGATEKRSPHALRKRSRLSLRRPSAKLLKSVYVRGVDPEQVHAVLPSLLALL
jgi:hypothetical protein